MFRSWFNFRALISLIILASIIIMLGSSIFMFVKSHYAPVATLHTMVGFCLLFAALWHLKNNFSPLKGYLRLRFWGKQSRYKLTLPLAFLSVGLLAGLSWFGIAPVQQFYQWGMTLRSSDLGFENQEVRYLLVDKALREPSAQQLSVEFKAGPAFHWPQYAIWLETLDGEFVQPVYVTQKLAENNFANRVSTRDKDTVFTDNPFERPGFTMKQAFELVVEPETRSDRFRSESLPVFLHQLAGKDNQAANSPNISSKISRLVDGYSGPTMMNNFIYKSGIEQKLSGAYKLRLEVNQSFDFNQYYSSDRFPEDAIYSGSGYSAQPSVIYEAEINFDKPNKLFVMELIGRGHHSGQDGKVHVDLSGMTSALQLVDRVLVEVNTSS